MMIQLLLQSGLDLTQYQPNAYQYFTAVGVVLFALTAYVVMKWRTPYSGLNYDESKTKSLFASGLKSANWKSTYVSKDDSREERKTYISQLLSGDSQELDTLKGTIIETRRVLSENNSGTHSDIIRYSGIGLIYMLFGLLAVGGVSLMPSMPNVGSTNILSYISEYGSLALYQFPFIELFGAGLLFIGYSIATIIFNQFMVLALVLISTGLILGIIKDKFSQNRVPDKSRPNIGTSLFQMFGSFVSLFLIGIVLNTILMGFIYGINSVINTEIPFSYAEYVSGFIIFIALLVAFGLFFRNSYSIFKLAYFELLEEDEDGEIYNIKEARINLTYYVLSIVSKVITSIAIVMIPTYIIYIIVSGRFTELIDIITSASWVVYILSLIALVIVGLVSSLYFNQSVKVLFDGLNRVIKLKSVRTKFFLTATPFAIVFGVTALVWAMPSISFVYGLIIGTIFAVIFRASIATVQKVKYRMALGSASEFVPPSKILIEITQMSINTDEDPVYVARIDGSYTILCVEEEEFVDTINELVEYKFEDGYIPITFNEVVFDDVRQLGQLDYDKSQKRMKNKVNHIILGTLKNNNGYVTKNRIYNEAEEHIPTEYIDDELKYLRRNGKIDKSDNMYQLLRFE